MENLMQLFADPTVWVALVTLVVMEIVLGIDNLIFISILSNKLPVEQRARARRLGIGGALIMRLILLGTIAWIVKLTTPIFSLFGQPISWRDLILIGGGLFLIWKATKEMHHALSPGEEDGVMDTSPLKLTMAAAVTQILLLDLVFSIDSIITAVGMTPHLPIMIIAVLVSVAVMLFAATPLSNFVSAHPTVVMLALAFLVMIGATLIAEGFGAKVPKGYIYAAMAFSATVEGLNIFARSRKARHKLGK
jgi:predicted tellurium resistance membrane protein TerC